MNNDLLTNKNDGILEITFNRPDRKNAISREMFEQLLVFLKSNIYNNDIKAVFFKGSADAFSAGGDVKDMASKQDLSTLKQKTHS